MAYIDSKEQQGSAEVRADREVRFSETKVVTNNAPESLSKPALQHITSMSRFGEHARANDGTRRSLDNAAPQSLLPEPELENAGADLPTEPKPGMSNLKKLRNTIRCVQLQAEAIMDDCFQCSYT